MLTSNRFRSAARPTLWHLGFSVAVVLVIAYLIFEVWYPHPYGELSGGKRLFFLTMIVYFVSGPLLTLVLFEPTKARWKWGLDLALIVCIQLAALLYGLHKVVDARPVFLVFEGNRFRVVRAMDIDSMRLQDASSEFRVLGLGGPKLIGARLTSPADPDFLASLNLSLQGLHPAFRPSRWVTYAEQREQVRSELKSIDDLKAKNAGKLAEIDLAITNTGMPADQLGYVPMVQRQIDDWVVIVGRKDAAPKAYLHLDGW